jgi:hypothetical protein
MGKDLLKILGRDAHATLRAAVFRAPAGDMHLRAIEGTEHQITEEVKRALAGLPTWLVLLIQNCDTPFP